MEEIYTFNDNIIKVVAPETPGVYFLGTVDDEGSFTVGYIGRSDFNLKKRLLSHNHKNRFTFFSLIPTKTKREAFFLETEYFYLFQGKTINLLHPQNPEGCIFESPYDVLGRTLKNQFLGGVSNE